MAEQEEKVKPIESASGQEDGADGDVSAVEDATDALERHEMRLRTAFAEGIEERERLLDELEEKSAANAALQSDVAALTVERDELKRALDELVDDQEQLRQALAETGRWLRRLERSRSWRLTRPIRWLGAVARRLRLRWATRRRRGA